MKYLPKELINEIREKSEILRSLNYSKRKLKYQNLKRKVIRKNALIHSYKIEHPRSRVPFSIPHNKNKKDIRRGMKNIIEAFRWGIENFNPNNFEEFFIRGLSSRITPELYDGRIGRYRDAGTRILGASVTPPYPFKLREIEIPNFVKSMKKQLTCNDLINRIETAIYAHFHLARIHPFVDGNGRTARILQDVILEYYDIPLPIIESGERNIYYDILDNAVLDWDEKKKTNQVKNGATKGEQLFYDFIAGKINVSLDKIID